MNAALHASLTYPSWIVPRLQSERRFWMGVVLSIFVHAALVLAIKMRPPEKVPGGGGPITVELSAPRPPSAAAAAPAPTPDVKRAPPRVALPPQMMTAPSKSPSAIPLDPPAPVRLPETAPQPSMMDMINARRAQREALESAIAADNAAARAREAGGKGGPINFAERLNLNPNKGDTGGVFEILTKGHRFATFAFNGWNPNRVNKWRDVIEVDAGLGGDVEIALVRRMITLIREHYKGDFRWDSRRVGQVVTLSARVEDTAALESFMIKEFFGDEPTERPRGEGRGDPRRDSGRPGEARPEPRRAGR